MLQSLIGGRATDAEGKVLTFCHAVQYHVNEDVSASPPRTVAETGEDDRLSSGQGGGAEETWRLMVAKTLREPLGLAGGGRE